MRITSDFLLGTSCPFCETNELAFGGVSDVEVECTRSAEVWRLLEKKTFVIFFSHQKILCKMSLWVDKHRPTSLHKLDYHKDQAAYLKKLVSIGMAWAIMRRVEPTE